MTEAIEAARGEQGSRLTWVAACNLSQSRRISPLVNNRKPSKCSARNHRESCHVKVFNCALMMSSRGAHSFLFPRVPLYSNINENTFPSTPLRRTTISMKNLTWWNVRANTIRQLQPRFIQIFMDGIKCFPLFQQMYVCRDIGMTWTELDGNGKGRRSSFKHSLDSSMIWLKFSFYHSPWDNSEAFNFVLKPDYSLRNLWESLQ